MNHSKLIIILLRLSIGSVFLYAAVAAALEPYNWIGFIPQIATKIVPTEILLTGFSLFQLILAVWILSGWETFYGSLIAAFTLLGIIVANWSDLNILFRDFAVFFAALALAAGSHKSHKT